MAPSHARLAPPRALTSRALTGPGSGLARLAAVLAVTTLAITGCTPDDGGEPAPVPSSTTSPSSSPPAPTPDPSGTGSAEAPSGSAATSPPGPVQPTGEPRVIASGLDLPWSLVRLDNGTTLVSERDTALVKEVTDAGAVREIGRVTGVVPDGEGGLLGLAALTETAGATSASPASPSATTPTLWLYAYMTAETDNRVVRMPLLGASGGYKFGPAEMILSGIPKAGNHNGGRIKFGPDGNLYVTAGDAGVRERSQNLGELGGKILRVAADGSIPADNPFPGSPVYSFGHRNPQGIAWDREGNLWASEFGQNTWDELNLIEPGVNYGWPIVEGISTDARYRNPVHQWSTAEASPSGLLWTRDTLFLAALRGERLWSIVPTPEAVTTTAFFTGQFGRLRDVIEGPNDTLWILTNNTGRAPRDGDDKILEVRVSALDKG